ncbi:ATP synthase F1 subunit gamma [Buchnera aphidicola]|uniref:ATP synthase F1 subunit gamma n=1 Tax=Buchnera aphidicola TaxID=9 RepID=UPI002093C266|nr:ATP synthase F1 subunit gamma [Buchnera aphidicola]USS94141.1 ATP synthase F1 subunit gamma [Buchnera aphidicola (Sipha maydis)]WII23689.1 ATP synthase F1 subunit gamma [Buchnera aphidicola (Sipha maydis)]
MINKKEIKNKINSVLNTKKITRAMEMISVIKMKKSKVKINLIQPYLNTLEKIICNLSNLIRNKKEKSLFFFQKKIKKIIFIVVLSSKGLCGNLNTNLFKHFLLYLKESIFGKFSFKIIIFGKKESIFINQLKENIQEYNFNFYKNFNFFTVKNFSNKIFQNYKKKKFHEIFIVYNKNCNKKKYIPIIEKLFPIQRNSKKSLSKNSWDYIYESDSSLLYENILNRFCTIKIYHSILENLINEYSSRIIAMKNATENSATLIQDLQVIYNKSRQFNITQELTEIISGASVVLMD